jgi:hypothetical protein
MSCEDTLEQFSACWEGLEDPRSSNAGLHAFHELLMIALCTVLCRGQGAVDMVEFAKAKEPFLPRLSQSGERRTKARYIQSAVS